MEIAVKDFKIAIIKVCWVFKGKYEHNQKRDFIKE